MDKTESDSTTKGGNAYFFFAFLLLSSAIAAAWSKSGISGLASMSLCVLVLVIVSRSSRKWAWILGIVLVPIAAITGHAIHDISEAKESKLKNEGPWNSYSNDPEQAPTPVLNKAIEQPNFSSTGHPAMEPKETCFRNYSEINPGLTNSFGPNSGLPSADNFVRSLCYQFNTPENPNREFDRCFLEAIYDSKSDNEFIIRLKERCNPIYKS